MGRHRPGSSWPSRKPLLTHFLCLPLVTEVSQPQLARSLQLFSNTVSPEDINNADQTSSRDPSSTLPRIHRKAIRPVGAIHCTLGVMSLKDDQLAQAINFLKSLDLRLLLESAVETRVMRDPEIEQCSDSAPSKSSALPLRVTLRGLESMHTPSKTSILYSAPADPTGRLYPFCLAVQKMFKDKGFLVNDDRELKLHATIVNTIYAKRKKWPHTDFKHQASGSSTIISVKEDHGSATVEDNEPKFDEPETEGHGPNANAPLKIDARRILNRFEDYVFADVTIDRIALCEMGTKKTFDTQGNIVEESYTEVATVPLPA